MAAQTTAELVFSELRGGGGDLMNSVDQEQTSCLEHLAVKLRPIKWTDEKHGLYLKSMEASFVDHLHDSIDILGWSSKKHPSDPSTQKHIISKYNSSGQFKVFKEGWRGKINFSRDEAEIKKEDESSGVEQISLNPWIRRYRSECRQRRRIPASLEEYLSVTDDFTASGFYVRHRVSSNRASVGPSLEVTDQNFIDEDTTDERECEIKSSKRIKTEAFSNED